MRVVRWVTGLIAAALLGNASPVTAAQVVPSDRVKRNVVVRSAPAAGSAALDALDPGEAFELTGNVPGWYQIRLPNGREGYVSKAWTVTINDQGPTAMAAGGYKLHMIDVGTGLAVFVEGPGFTMLYDGGSQDDLATGSSNRIVAYLKAVRPDLLTIDHLVLSHPHKDHLELLPDVFDRYVVRNVWDSGTVNATRGYCRFLRKVAAEPGVQYHDAIASGGLHSVAFAGSDCSGTVSVPQASQMTAAAISIGAGARMTILYRDPSNHADPNENSVVVRLDLGTQRVLLMGDAEAGDRASPSTSPKPTSIEGQLPSCCRAELRANVVVVGHHGSLTSSRRAFLDAVGASIFLVSSGPHPYQSVRLQTPPRSRSSLRAAK